MSKWLKTVLIVAVLGALVLVGIRAMKQSTWADLGMFGLQFASAQRLARTQVDLQRAAAELAACQKTNADLRQVRDQLTELIAQRALDAQAAHAALVERERAQIRRDRELELERQARAGIVAGEDCRAWARGLMCQEIEASVRASRRRLIEEAGR